jgi:hypothetical protein
MVAFFKLKIYIMSKSKKEKKATKSRKSQLKTRKLIVKNEEILSKMKMLNEQSV